MQQDQPAPFLDSFLQGHQKGLQFGQQFGYYGKSVRTIARGAWAAATMLCHFAVIPVEALLRRRFGQRYFNLTKWFIGMLVFFMFGPWAIDSWIGEGASWEEHRVWFFANAAFTLALLTMGIWQVAATHLASRKGAQWHTYSDGLPLGFWRRIGLRDGFVRHYGEPLACIAAAVVLLLVAAPVSLYLFGVGLVLWIREASRRGQERNQLLDAMDRRIEAEQQTSMLEGKPAIETKGFVARGMQPRTTAERKTLEEMIANLEPPARAWMVPSTVSSK